tara:strand:- start:932 stop:1174 length:243 start_codon:yes stop_codon:yes gene_type:complete
MALTRKHFNQLAEVVADFPETVTANVLYKNHAEAVDIKFVKNELAGKIAKICWEANGNFDFDRFFEACDVEKDEALNHAF